MRALTMFQVDAFADRPFTGNPAAVMPLDAGDGPFSSDDGICQPLPLRDGLAR